jgi:hypothetical protein
MNGQRFGSCICPTFYAAIERSLPVSEVSTFKVYLLRAG